MASVIQFSWTRLEGIGLILTSLGIGFLAQIPPVLFAFILLYFDIKVYLIAIIGAVIGSSTILAVISCSLAEDWNDSTTPNLTTLMTISLFYLFVFLLGFFSFFLIEPFFPPEVENISPEQQYFSALTLALVIVGTTTVIFYKGKKFFRG